MPPLSLFAPTHPFSLPPSTLPSLDFVNKPQILKHIHSLREAFKTLLSTGNVR